MAEAGWYPDPRDPQHEVYFDGQQWTAHRRPAGAAQPAPPGPAQPQPAPPQAAPRAEGQWTAPSPPAPQPETQSESQWTAPLAPAPPAPQAPQPEGQWTSPQSPAQPAPPPPQPEAPWATPQAPQPDGQWAAPQPASAPPADGQWGAPPTQPAPPWGPPPGQQWGPGEFAPPPGQPPKRRRRRLLIGALAAVVVIAGGGLAWVLWPSSSPSLTYQGKSIQSPAKVLTAAESEVAALVKDRHGVSSADTRCYFAKQAHPAKGARSSDVDGKLRCGPVLFVDGDAKQAYLLVPLTSSVSGGHVTLTPATSLSGIDPSAVQSSITLVRPDSKTAPQGADGLRVPQPPAATSNVLTADALGPVPAPKALDNVRMVGQSSAVTLVAAGQVPRYGAGDEARSAPAGQRLIAFQVSYGAGDLNSGGSTQATVVVPGLGSRPLPDFSAGQWIIVAAPVSATPTLQFTDGGTQTLTLPDGKPGAGNLTVLTRTHRSQQLSVHTTLPVQLSRDGQSVSETYTVTASYASLDYWIPGHQTLHAKNPQSAVLSFQLGYTDSGDPGPTFGFDPPQLSLHLPGGAVLHSRNVADSKHVFDVFDVPATFTGGTLVIGGTEVVDGISVQLRKTVSIPLSFPAG